MLSPHEIAALMILAHAPSTFSSEHAELGQLAHRGLVVIEAEPTAPAGRVSLSVQGQKIVMRLAIAQRQGRQQDRLAPYVRRSKLSEDSPWTTGPSSSVANVRP